MNTNKEQRPVVLIADDDPSMRFLARSALNPHDFNVIEAENGRRALESFANDTPDLVLLDVDMPDVDGFAVCRHIRDIPAGANVPIIMVTCLEDPESIHEAYKAGATDFIVKPINWALLGHRVRYVLRGATNVNALATSESKNRALLTAMPDTIFVIGSDGVIEQQMGQFEGTRSCTKTNLIGQPFGQILPGTAAVSALDCIRRVLETRYPQSFEYEIVPEDGKRRYYEGRYVPHGEGKILAIVRNITERKLAEARIRYLARYDQLTGLPNRRLFKESLDAAITDAETRREWLAVLNVDIDYFSRINETLGDSAGDALLKMFARRLAASVRAPNIAVAVPASSQLARVGGNDFAVLLERLQDESQITEMAKHISDCLSQPFSHLGREFVVTTSVGISVYPRHGRDTETLLKNAGAAKLEAKEAGRNTHRVYVSRMNTRALEKLDIENDLRRALQTGELELHYQPKFCAKTLKVVGAEALLRWLDPRRGEVPVSTFIRVAEETGLITDVSQWVLGSVCQQIGAWQRAKTPIVPIAINLSGQEFCNGNSMESISGIVDSSMDPANIEFEITETVLMRDINAAYRTLTALKRRGFSIAVDDFGTGYCSLAYLQQFPVDTIKIDRSFVKDLDAADGKAAICSAIIALGRNLNLKVVAEGVEEYSQLHFLRSRNCDVVQGYYLSEPMPAAKFESLLLQHRRPEARGDDRDWQERRSSARITRLTA